MIIVQKIGECERRYSDAGVKIRQVETGTLWNDAINVAPCVFTYEETEIPIDHDQDIEDSDALSILLGEGT